MKILRIASLGSSFTGSYKKKRVNGQTIFPWKEGNIDISPKQVRQLA